MNLTYFVMIEMLEATYDLRSRIVGRLAGYINLEDYLSSENLDTTRLFFNENAAKGIDEYVQLFGNEDNVAAYIVGVPEDMSIYEYEDVPLDDFEDLIEIFPKRSDRYNLSIGSFERSSETVDSSKASSNVDSDRRQIIFERAAKIVEDLDANDYSKDSVDRDISDRSDSTKSEDQIIQLMPSSETLKELITARLDIEDDHELSEVIISQSESSLAIMQTLMSDDLSEVEKIDVEAVNMKILPKIRASSRSEEYLNRSKDYQEFIDQARETESEIRSRYQRNLDHYIAESIKQIEAEYRSKVPDTTEQDVIEYYNSISSQFVDINNALAQSEADLKKEIIEEFVSADRSSPMKSLKKFLVLKDQIRLSALTAISRVKSRSRLEDHISDHLATSHPQQVNYRSSETVVEEQDVEIHRTYENVSHLTEPQTEFQTIEEHDQSEVQSMPAEELDASTVAEETIVLEDQPTEDARSNAESDPTDNSDQDSQSTFTTDRTVDDEAESIDEIDVRDEEMKIEQNVQVSSVDLSQLIAESEDEASDEQTVDTGSRKKMSLLAKVGIGALGLLATSALVFGSIYAVNRFSGGSKKDQTVQTSSSSKKIGDTIFNVGDNLTITGQDGESLDVTIKEFKEDGSAVAVDANEDLWLITAEQMKEYADAHPEQFEKTKSSKDQKTEDSSSSDANAESQSSATSESTEPSASSEQPASGN